MLLAQLFIAVKNYFHLYDSFPYRTKPTMRINESQSNKNETNRKKTKLLFYVIISGNKKSQIIRTLCKTEEKEEEN